MAPSAKDGRCCICGKKKRTHPGTTLHLFPKDTKRRMQWLRALNIAYEKDSQAICGDHFDAIWHGSKGRLLKNAIPHLPGDMDEQGAGTHLELPKANQINASDMNTDLTSEELPLNHKCDSTNFGVLSLNSIDCQDSRIPDPSIQTSSLAKSDLLCADVGGDRIESNLGLTSQNYVPDHQEIHVGESLKTQRLPENVLFHKSIGGGNTDEDCKGKKCFVVGVRNKKIGTTKSIKQQTYPGPIRRQVVRTIKGEKRTIMIINKVSLKNLQAKGLIQPMTKYVAKHPNALQSVKNIQSSSNSGDNPSKSLQTEDSHRLKEADSSRKSSSILNTQPTTDVRESSTESKSELDASSHTLQAHKLQAPNQDSKALFAISRASVSNSKVLTDVCPTSIRHEPLLKETSQLIDSANCTVTWPDSQVKDPPSRPDNQSPNNSGISADERIKANKGDDKLILDMKCLSKKQADIDHDYCSMISGLTKISSTATPTHKHPNPLCVIIPSILDEASSEKKRTLCSKSLEESRNEDQLVKKRSGNKDSLKWIDLPSMSVHQLKSSSSGTFEQVQQASFTRKFPLSNSTIHSLPKTTPRSSEHSSTVEGPITSLEQQGKRLCSPVAYSPYRSANKELKLRYNRLLNKHRRRYYFLMKKYKVLEQKISVVKDVGTPEQVIRDARKFLSEEHCLFLESQMFLKNRPGTGNRFSRKFMKLMIEYFKRSAAGYKYLRTIFTIPSVGTIQKWLSKPNELAD